MEKARSFTEPEPARAARTAVAAGEGLPSAWFEPCVHSAYVRIFSKMLQARGLLLPWPPAGQGRLLPFLDILPLLDAIQAVTRPHAGAEVGMAIPAVAHGLKGMAAMSSPSIWKAMETVVRYARIRDHIFEYRCTRSHGYATLQLHPRLPLHQYTRFMQTATVYTTFGLFRAIADPAALGEAVILLPGAAPQRPAPGAQRSAAEPLQPAAPLMPAATWRVQYESRLPGVQFPLALADELSQTADADMHQRMCKAGDEELNRLAGSVGARVRHLMHQAQPAWPTLATLAERLALSPRTLIRRLEAEELSYQLLLDEVRNELACWYLRQSRLAMSDIAEKTGFSDQTNFTRAFVRWQGKTPTDYRRHFQVGGAAGAG